MDGEDHPAFDETYDNRPISDYSKARQLEKAALNELPEATSTNARGATQYSPHPMIFLEEAKGPTARDVDGNEYIDYNCGFSSIILGHADERQNEAVRDQLERGTLFGTGSRIEYETAKLFNEIVPCADRTKFTNSGTEAIMSSIRLARAYTGKEKILKFEGMYHGHNDYVMINNQSGTADVGSRRNPNKIPTAPGVPKKTMETVEVLPWNDIELVEEKLSRNGDDIAAVITEAVMSNSGLLRPNQGFLDGLRRLTREHDILLILDEVVTGFRMGLQGAQGHYDIDPDLAVFGKALANGYPTGALTGRETVMGEIKRRPDKATFLGTYTGNPLTMVGTKANLEILTDIGQDGYDEFLDRGQRLVQGLREIITDAGHEVFIPDFAGYFFIHFLRDGSDPENWSGWRDIDQHVDMERCTAFAKSMIGEGILFVPTFGRVTMTHSHKDEHIDETLEAAKNAVRSL